MRPLTEREMDVFDAVKSAAKAREGDLSLMRMMLDDREVAVLVRMMYNPDRSPLGFEPLAVVLDEDDLENRLRSHDGRGPEVLDPEDVRAPKPPERHSPRRRRPSGGR